VCGLLAGAVPLSAHHSFAAEYDANKPITVTGVVTKLEWMNPHARFYVDVKDCMDVRPRDIKRDMLDLLEKDAYENVHGSTDSEHLAALYMTFLTQKAGGKKQSWEQQYSVSDMKEALASTFKTIIKLKDRTTHFYTSLGVGAHLEFWGIPTEKITELDWWETVAFDPQGRPHFGPFSRVRQRSWHTWQRSY